MSVVSAFFKLAAAGSMFGLAVTSRQPDTASGLD